VAVSPYTRERLAEAARSSRALSEALLTLGVDPKSSTRRYVQARMRSMGIDTSHFEREGARWTREILEPAVAASTSVYDVLRHLGPDAVGGHRSHISRRIEAHGIDTSHFIPRGRRTQRRRRRPEDLLVEQNPHNVRRVPGDRLRRAMLQLGVMECCALCGTGPQWRGRPLPLEVDHVDGDQHDDRAENLRLLCPNCHAVTRTWCRGGALRKERGGTGWSFPPCRLSRRTATMGCQPAAVAESV
jgi:hypothetical protein